MRLKISKDEIKYIGIAIVFSFFLFVLIIPNILNSLDSVNVFVSFIIFNLGIFIFLQIYLRAFISDKKIKWKNSFGILFLFMALDTLIPPLLVSPQGILNNSIILGSSATDYVFGYLAIQIGLSGFIVYLFTYILMPTILLLISALLLKNLIEEL